jgi:hypothetical protein
MDIKSLPKDPIEALKATIEYVLSIVGTGDGTFGSLRDKNIKIGAELVKASIVARRVTPRIDDVDVRNLVLENMTWKEGDSMKIVQKKRRPRSS